MEKKSANREVQIVKFRKFAATTAAEECAGTHWMVAKNRGYMCACENNENEEVRVAASENSSLLDHCMQEDEKNWKIWKNKWPCCCSIGVILLWSKISFPGPALDLHGVSIFWKKWSSTTPWPSFCEDNWHYCTEFCQHFSFQAAEICQRQNVHSDILSGFFSGSLFDIWFGVFSDVIFDMFFGIIFHILYILFGILFNILFGIFFDILSDISFKILFGILFDLLSGISSDILSDVFFVFFDTTYLLTFYLAFYLKFYLVFLWL